MNLHKLRRLVAMDVADPLSRFALGSKLAEDESPEALNEAAEHLRFANTQAPDHLATYHALAGVLIRQKEHAEATRVLEEGIRRTDAVGEGMGRDLGPAMRNMLANLGL